jgi:hypothetical protein
VSEPRPDAPLLRRHARLQFFEPIDHDLNLRSRRRAGRGLSASDDAEESLAVECDVVAKVRSTTQRQ